MVQMLFTVFGMGNMYEDDQIMHNHGTLLHTTVNCFGRHEDGRRKLYISTKDDHQIDW